MPKGARVTVDGFGKGSVTGFRPSLIGGNVHVVQFDVCTAGRECKRETEAFCPTCHVSLVLRGMKWSILDADEALGSRLEGFCDVVYVEKKEGGFGIVIDSEGVITSVVNPGLTGDVRGHLVKVGGKVIELNGESVEGRVEIAEVLSACAVGEHVKFTIKPPAVADRGDQQLL